MAALEWTDFWYALAKPYEQATVIGDYYRNEYDFKASSVS
jgi:hypothetical protein